MRAFLVLLLVVVSVGCAQGTGTGNPFTTVSNPAGGTVPSSVSEDVFENLCLNIERCHPETTVVACDTAIAGLTTFGPALGLGAGSTLTGSQIVVEEATAQIVANANAGLSCISAMNALACGSSAMAAAVANDFAAAAAVLDPVCAGVFGP